MRNDPALLPKTLAIVRMATACFFLLFGQYKLFSPEFTHGGFQQYLQSYSQGSAVSLYQSILGDLVLPHAVFFGYLIGALEFSIGICLLLGFWVKPASIIGRSLRLHLGLLRLPARSSAAVVPFCHFLRERRGQSLGPRRPAEVAVGEREVPPAAFQFR